MPEKNLDKQAVRIKNLSLMVGKSEDVEKFIDELEALCKKYAVEKDYHFNFNVDG